MVSTTIMGIDLALAKMGICGLRIQDDKIADVHAKLVESKDKDFDTSTGRFAHMCNIAQYSIDNAYPEIVVCEYPFNVKGNGRVLVEMYGVVRLHCFRKGIPFIPVAQTSLKKYATGNGKADKKDMQEQLYTEFGHNYGPDECDAFWMAHLGYTIRYGSGVSYRKELAKGLKDKHLT